MIVTVAVVSAVGCSAVVGVVVASSLSCSLLSIVTMSLANPLIFILLFNFSKWDMVVINILTTIGSAVIGLLVSIMILNIPLLPDPIIFISMAGIIVIVVFYLFATFCQTDDFMFLDPVTKKITLKKDN